MRNLLLTFVFLVLSIGPVWGEVCSQLDGTAQEYVFEPQFYEVAYYADRNLAATILFRDVKNGKLIGLLRFVEIGGEPWPKAAVDIKDRKPIACHMAFPANRLEPILAKLKEPGTKFRLIFNCNSESGRIEFFYDSSPKP